MAVRRIKTKIERERGTTKQPLTTPGLFRNIEREQG